MSCVDSAITTTRQHLSAPHQHPQRVSPCTSSDSTAYSARHTHNSVQVCSAQNTPAPMVSGLWSAFRSQDSSSIEISDAPRRCPPVSDDAGWPADLPKLRKCVDDGGGGGSCSRSTWLDSRPRLPPEALAWRPCPDESWSSCSGIAIGPRSSARLLLCRARVVVLLTAMPPDPERRGGGCSCELSGSARGLSGDGSTGSMVSSHEGSSSAVGENMSDEGSHCLSVRGASAKLLRIAVPAEPRSGRPCSRRMSCVTSDAMLCDSRARASQSLQRL